MLMVTVNFTTPYIDSVDPNRSGTHVYWITVKDARLYPRMGLSWPPEVCYLLKELGLHFRVTVTSLFENLSSIVFQVMLMLRPGSMFKAFAVRLIQMASLTFLLYQLVS